MKPLDAHAPKMTVTLEAASALALARCARDGCSSAPDASTGQRPAPVLCAAHRVQAGSLPRPKKAPPVDTTEWEERARAAAASAPRVDRVVREGARFETGPLGQVRIYAIDAGLVSITDDLGWCASFDAIEIAAAIYRGQWRAL